VLTSGGASRAGDGLASGAHAARVAASGGVEVMAGGGVRVDDVAALVAAGLAGVHLSASTTNRPSRGEDGGSDAAGTDAPLVSLGSAGATDAYAVTDASVVQAARAALDAALGTTRAR
jgi:copper homeostasis protein